MYLIQNAKDKELAKFAEYQPKYNIWIDEFFYIEKECKMSYVYFLKDGKRLPHTCGVKFDKYFTSREDAEKFISENFKSNKGLKVLSREMDIKRELK